MTDSHDDQLLKQLGERARDVQSREALRPLGEDFNARMREQIKASLNTASAEDEEPQAPLQAANSSRWLALAASALAAVGLSFVVMTRDAVAPLPGYELAMSGGAKMRSDDTRAPLQLGDKFSAMLRPDVDVDAELDVRIYRRSDDGWSDVPAEVAVSDSGAARITIVLNEDAGVVPGAQDWWFVIGRSESLPAPNALPDRDRAGKDDWAAFRERFDVVP